MSLTLPKLQIRLAITNQDGTPTTAFHRFFTVDFAGAIERNDAQQQETLDQLAIQVEQIQAALQAAQAAQAAVGGLIPGNSGSASNPSVNLTGGNWTLGPVVSLTGVVAGNLTITGTGPAQDEDVNQSPGGNINGEFRVVEVVGGVDEVLFTGLFGSNSLSGTTSTIINRSISEVAAFSVARTSTGDVDYRIDARTVSPPAAAINSLELYLYVNRSV